MGQTATYSCTALAGTNKAGTLTADADGYYEVILGALDIFNSQGAFYVYETGKKLFEESGSLQRRIKNGVLRGELGHPKFLPGMSKRDYMARIMQIYEDCIAFHISEVWIDSDRVVDKDGRKVIAILGKIKPCGPHGETLKASLENKSENVCFSIRSITNDVMMPNGIVHKHLHEIVTWDNVNEPGLHVANKYMFPSLESMQDVTFTDSNLREVKMQCATLNIGMESSGGISADMLIKSLGWDKPVKKEGSIPPSGAW